jgi:acyl transferase domain-containing protein/acyl carrier protein/SAM-dependent methyltransferase
VITDELNATVTAPTASLDALSQSLASNGLCAKRFDLRGRFHHPAHKKALDCLRNLVASNPAFQFSHSELLAPVYSNIDGQLLSSDSIIDTLLQSILVQRCDWHASISTALHKCSSGGKTNVFQFSLVECIPPSLLRQARLSVHRITDVPVQTSSATVPTSLIAVGARFPTSEPIAIIGMGCKFPGADTLEEYWLLLAQGTSMCRTMPEERFKTSGLRRSPDEKVKFWGNFVNDVDAFDHRFFKKSSREAASMDPQQRLVLQVAYQTLESAEYSGLSGIKASRDVGCYLGLCASDYTDNVASHPPNAFSSLGTLRAFLSGKISHFFGWTGPSITYDTACSSSAVAIQAACRALQTGECSMALAGGVSLYTSPNFYQNLAAASFLSPTGPTKPFDAKGDGYCRGEGVGLVFLKPLSAALADHDNIMGVIAAAAVNQNQNSTAITVPHSESQIELYRKVVSEAGLHPHDVSFVEAHGTGTPVGDPIEFTSIRTVFGGSDRADPLAIASVKGNIGHTEGASGVASLIKTVLMLQRGMIPMQANHATLNPKIAPLQQDKVTIPNTTQPWSANFKAACINNYGAAGSNAAMIVTEAPTGARPEKQGTLPKCPIYVSANTASSLKAYCKELLRSLRSRAPDCLASLAFQLANTQNRGFPHALITSVTSKAELEDQLSAAVENKNSSLQTATPTERPVVLAFGGQVARSVGLSRQVYDSSTVLRTHLSNCDGILTSAGLNSIFPAIFQKEPIADVVLLHSALFSAQYACAMTWIDAGVVPAAVIGHSFGQLTALSVSGVLSLKDGLSLITGRAKLMRDAWGPEPGSMVSAQADVQTVTRLMKAAETKDPKDTLEIACFNGPMSHVIVGSADAADRLEAALAQESIRYKRLAVSHGFHSKLTEPLLPGLEQCAERLTFRTPKYPIETCSSGSSWTEFNASMIVQHTRTAVYYTEALARITARLGPCTWLEVGAGCSVAGMIRSALNVPSDHLIQAVNLAGETGTAALADATVNLWKSGHKLQFWSFHRSERACYQPLELPPYQFEKTRHWLDWKDTVAEQTTVAHPTREESPVEEFLTFVKYKDSTKQQAEFRISTQHGKYSFFVKGHAVLAEPLCPAPLYIDLACQAGRMVYSDTSGTQIMPSVEDLEIQAPLGVGDRVIILRLQQSTFLKAAWTFCFCSRPATGVSAEEQLHATGTVVLRANDTKTAAEFSRFGRLVSSKRAQEMRSDPDCHILQGPVVYQLFSRIVTYADYYKGVQSVYASGTEVMGRIRLPPTVNDANTRRPLLVDNFIQTAGIHVNCLTDVGAKEVYVCTKVDRVQSGATFTEGLADVDASWIVHSSYHPTSEKEVVNDIFVFNAATGELALFILGAHFTRVQISSLGRALSRANTADGAPVNVAVPVQSPTLRAQPKRVLLPPVTKRSKTGPTLENSEKLKETLSRVIEVPVADIHDGDFLADLGVDSLLGTEVLNEINQVFNVSIPANEFALLADVASISKCLASHLGAHDSGFQLEDLADADSVDSDSDVPTGAVTSGITTPDDSVSRLADLLAEHLEYDGTIEASNNLADLGLDSILSIELANDIKNIFNCDVDMSQLSMNSTFADLVALVPALDIGQSLSSLPASLTSQGSGMENAQHAFEQIRFDYDVYTKETGFNDFWKRVYPAQSRLVLAYTVEAFAQLGCDLAVMQPGDRLPKINCLPTHEKLVQRLYDILRDGMLVATSDSGLVRTDKPVDPTSSPRLLEEINMKAPQHASEHGLLHITGSKLADCLTGAVDPLNLLFRSKANRDLLAEVYLNGPMYAAISGLLCSFLGNAFSGRPSSGTFQILELGGGTGGTTGHVLDYLVRSGIPFTYTFSDVSGSFVAAARKKFAGRPYMEYQVTDIEKEPADSMIGKFHAVISTNCIHATRNLEISTGNIHKMLRPDGFVALVEFTRNIYWFDLVFGLLEGWWLFEDGRQHVIASEHFWNTSMRKAGFQHVSWTDGDSLEARTLRLITGFRAPAANEIYTPRLDSRDTETAVESVMYKQTDGIPLFADVYYPPSVSNEPRPIGELYGHPFMHVREADCEPCSPDGPRRRPRDALSQGHSSEADGTPALARLSPGLDRLPSLPRDYVDRRANAGC